MTSNYRLYYNYIIFLLCNYNLPITPVLFKRQVKLRNLRSFGLLVEVFHCQRYRDLVVLAIVNRIYQFLKDVFFPDWL